jgi:hypothetical protein
MIEMYGFIAAFIAQIIVFSVLGPLRVTEVLRVEIQRFITGQSPPIDPHAATRVDRRLRLLRSLGLGTAVIGVALLVAMIRYMQRPNWTDGPLEAVVPAYWAIQILPTLIAVFAAGIFHGVLKKSLPVRKRKALLQPRSLFDFVSRSAIALAVLVYFLDIALLVYVERHPFPGFAGLPVNAALLTGMYILMGVVIYMTLRKMGSSPLQGREDRMRSVGVAVKVCVYSCILGVLNISMNMALILLDQQRWEPTFASIGLILTGILARMALKEQMRIPETTGAVNHAMAHQA